MLTYNQWKNSVVGDFSHAERIGEDLILLKGAELMQKELGPFHTDMTIAIILNEGSLKINIDMTDYEAASPCMVIIMHKQPVCLMEFGKRLIKPLQILITYWKISMRKNRL